MTQTISLAVMDASDVGEARRQLNVLTNRLGFNETERGKAAIVVTEAANRNVATHGPCRTWERAPRFCLRMAWAMARMPRWLRGKRYGSSNSTRGRLHTTLWRRRTPACVQHGGGGDSNDRPFGKRNYFRRRRKYIGQHRDRGTEPQSHFTQWYGRVQGRENTGVRLSAAPGRTAHLTLERHRDTMATGPLSRSARNASRPDRRRPLS